MYLFLGFFDRVRSTGTWDNFRPNGNDLSKGSENLSQNSIFQSSLRSIRFTISKYVFCFFFLAKNGFGEKKTK